MKRYYKFNSEKLNYENISRVEVVKEHIGPILGVFLLLMVIVSFGLPKEIIDRFIPSEKEVIIIDSNENSFSEDKLIKELDRLNFKFPHIVLAQSILETGNFTSTIFKENHNLFGMKQARVRLNTAKGTHRGHAFYNNWVESVIDYGFYSSRYLSKLKTEKDYFQYLSEYYAEDVNYVNRLREIIKREGLKEKFK